jgi:hypothetical protein
MKKSCEFVVESMARSVLGRPWSATESHSLFMHSQALFLEELCFLTKQYIEVFNELVSPHNPDASCRMFDLAPPRTGLMVLKGAQKLVISVEGKNVCARMVLAQVNSTERDMRTLTFEPRKSDLGFVSWQCKEDHQIVNPELIMQHYIPSFFSQGFRPQSGKYPRLVVATGS